MTSAPNTETASADLPDDHWVLAMNVELASAPPDVTGHTRIESAMRSAVTGRVRLGVLATMADVVAGHVPDGPRTPTIDLRVQVVGAPPPDGPISVRARPLKVGRRLVVSQTDLHDASDTVFATSTATFMNQPIAAEAMTGMTRAPKLVGTFEQLMGARVLDDATLEVDPSPRLSNGLHGTVQGGAQAFLAELTADHLLAGRRASAVDLDIRYLNRLRSGPLRARAAVVGSDGDRTLIQVALTDADDDRVVSHVSLTMSTDEEPAP